MPDHKCSTCKHYEPAPMWKKGWCRNPLLYSPQQSHLVGEDDLDCNRGMGSYWEAIDPNVTPPIEAMAREEVRRSAAARIETGRFTPPPPRNIAPASSLPPEAQAARRAAPSRTTEEPIMVRHGEGEAVPRQRARRPNQGAAPLRSNDPEGYASGPQEHYSWGDYLRRSYPVVGVILLLGAFWLWSARQLAGDPQITPTVVPTPSAVPAAAPTVVVITPSVPAAAGTGPGSTLPVPPPGVIAPGARVVIATSGAGANIRAEPTTSAAIVTSQDDGVILTITGASQTADDYVWWPVQGDGFAGWVAEALIAPAP